LFLITDNVQNDIRDRTENDEC